MIIQHLFGIAMDRVLPNVWDMPEGLILNVGAGNKVIAGSIALDYPEWDADGQDIPYEDGVVSGIHCYHFLEHCTHPVFVLQEFQRILIPGGVINICVPYYNSQMQAQDLDHKSQFCEETWRVLFNNPYYNKNRVEWKFEIGLNIIIGLKERNLALLTQMRRTS